MYITSVTRATTIREQRDTIRRKTIALSIETMPILLQAPYSIGKIAAALLAPTISSFGIQDLAGERVGSGGRLM